MVSEIMFQKRGYTVQCEIDYTQYFFFVTFMRLLMLRRKILCFIFFFFVFIIITIGTVRDRDMRIEVRGVLRKRYHHGTDDNSARHAPKDHPSFSLILFCQLKR